MYEPEVGSKKELAIILSKLKVFDKPKIRLEQYPTDSEVAADIFWDMIMRDIIQGKHVVDLGCGTGILGIGALQSGASHVTFVEVDEAALITLRQNLEYFPDISDDRYDIICSDIKTLNSLNPNAKKADIVIMNPPFGTRDEHADLAFLTKALELAPIIYSMHKTTTLQYIKTWISKKGAEIINQKDYEFPIKQTYTHQTRKIMRIEVSCLEIQNNNKLVK